MLAAASSGAAMASSHRGICWALFAVLPALLFALMLREPIAFAGSSVLEIEPPSHEDSRHPSAAPNQKLSNLETNQRCDSQKASDHASDDHANAAQNPASADATEPSRGDVDGNDAAGRGPPTDGAYS